DRAQTRVTEAGLAHHCGSLAVCDQAEEILADPTHDHGAGVRRPGRLHQGIGVGAVHLHALLARSTATARMRVNSIVADCLLLFWWAAVSYVGLEIAFRVYLFYSIRHELVERLDLGTSDGLHIFDSLIGYRRTPNTTWENTGGYLHNRFRVNEHGLIAND